MCDALRFVVERRARASSRRECARFGQAHVDWKKTNGGREYDIVYSLLESLTRRCVAQLDLKYDLAFKWELGKKGRYVAWKVYCGSETNRFVPKI